MLVQMQEKHRRIIDKQTDGTDEQLVQDTDKQTAHVGSRKQRHIPRSLTSLPAGVHERRTRTRKERAERLKIED